MKVSHIAILVPKFPNLLQTYVLNHIEGMNKLKIKTTIIASKRGDVCGLPDFIKKFGLIENAYYIGTSKISFFSQLFTTPIFNKAYRRTIRKLVKERIWKQYGLKYFLFTFIRARIFSAQRYQIIHSHSLFSSFDYLFIKDISSIPFITTYHGQVPAGVKRIENWKLALLFKKTDIFIVNTEYSKNILVKMGCEKEKIRIIPQGIKLHDFPFKKRSLNINNPIRLLSVGRLSIEKGHAIGINAVNMLKKSGVNIVYHIVGTGPEMERLQSTINNLNLEKTVVLSGLKTGNNLQKEFEASHIFLFPSISTHDGYAETQGVVIQEAQASGLAVIGSKTGAVPDVVNDNITGLLFTEGDEKELAKKLMELIDNPNHYSDICSNARKAVEQYFDINIIVKLLLQLYHDKALITRPQDNI